MFLSLSSVHITDPFDLNHNLGAGLSRKSKIISVFCCLIAFMLLCLVLSFQMYCPVLSHLFFIYLFFFIFFYLSFKSVTNFIMKAFINGRTVFGTPVKTFPPVYPSQMVSICCVNAIFALLWWKQALRLIYLHLLQEYFFDPEVLTEGEVAPNDRCCRICGKIGHFMKDCPMRKK